MEVSSWARSRDFIGPKATSTCSGRSPASNTRTGIHARLLLLGTGPEEGALKARARELDIEDEVSFLGWKRDPLPYYRVMDVFCHPSLQKGYEQVTVEAMALGKGDRRHARRHRPGSGA